VACIIKEFLKKINDYLPIGQCILCHEPVQEQVVCDNCLKLFDKLVNSCFRCAYPLTQQDASLLLECGACLTEKRWFDQTICPFVYQYPLDILVKELKFKQNLSLAHWFARQMMPKISQYPLPELIIPVPLHYKRLVQRGFNQSTEIAKVISRELSIPLDTASLKKVKNTLPQSQLPAEQRQNNIKNAFRLTKKLSVTHIALLDDVLTTGNTLNEISSLIKSQSAVKKIDIWLCARTIN
jgi:ComF family protein